MENRVKSSNENIDKKKLLSYIGMGLVIILMTTYSIGYALGYILN